jgi:hypothetical protein
MAKRDNDLARMIDGVLANVQAGERKFVDIITFCEDAQFLNFSGQGVELWPMQRIVLKMFYRGTRGNEHVQLTDAEIAILDDIASHEDLDYVDSQGGFRQVIEKYKRWTPHRTLQLVMGRRSSKTMMVSIIAAYEAYKLLESPNGDPHKFYKIPPDKPIAIINVAVSEQQAYDPLFLEIQARIARSPYFQDKVNHGTEQKGRIYLLTDADKKENARRKAAGNTLLLDGSIVLMSGHSNSASLRGKAAIVILFDEFAHFTNTSGKQSGDEVYSALYPSTQQFGVDGKIVLLSDPRGKEGMFWKLFEMSQRRGVAEDGQVTHPNDDILSLQLPTWRMNPSPFFARKYLEETERSKDPLSFLSTWAARFCGEEGAQFFIPEKIDECTDINRQESKFGDQRYTYHIHLDPAKSSHNYALAMTHAVTMVNKQGLVKRQIVLDYMKFWRPKDSVTPIDIMEIEKEIIDLCRRFRVDTVTFDQFQSAQTIQRLRSFGINAYETTFRTGYIAAIYGELKTLVNQGDLILYPHHQLIGEMKNVRYKLTASGFQRKYNPKSDFPSDDCVDALAGSVYPALRHIVSQNLPRSALVYMPGR